VSGFLCPAMDADALYIKMKAFLDLTPEQRAAMGRAGRALMERDFDKDGVVAATLDRILASDGQWEPLGV
ncbi:glycosyltransferase family 1 protein, partial [bacterium]|nr:glycosyltransferase family 1 protein [bacterium]